MEKFIVTDGKYSIFYNHEKKDFDLTLENKATEVDYTKARELLDWAYKNRVENGMPSHFKMGLVKVSDRFNDTPVNHIVMNKENSDTTIGRVDDHDRLNDWTGDYRVQHFFADKLGYHDALDALKWAVDNRKDIFHNQSDSSIDLHVFSVDKVPTEEVVSA